VHDLSLIFQLEIELGTPDELFHRRESDVEAGDG